MNEGEPYIFLAFMAEIDLTNQKKKKKTKDDKN